MILYISIGQYVTEIIKKELLKIMKKKKIIIKLKLFKIMSIYLNYYFNLNDYYLTFQPSFWTIIFSFHIFFYFFL